MNIIYPENFDRYKMYHCQVDVMYRSGKSKRTGKFYFKWTSEFEEDRLIKKVNKFKLPSEKVVEVKISIIPDHEIIPPFF